jgi:acyl-CoA synthetase (AMP-forming)/AMP-acid ligase II
MPISGPWPSQAPYPKNHLSDLLRDSAEQRGDKTALIGPDEKAYTFRDVWDASRKIARMLHDAGVGKRQAVGILSPNCAEYAPALHGILLAGGIATTLNPLYREREIAHQLHDAEAVACFVARPLVPLVNAARHDVPSLRHIYVLDDAWEMAAEVKGEPEPVELDYEKDIAVLPYSSGTTGLPKGVMLSHYNISSNLRQVMATELVRVGEAVFLDFLPFYHIYGLVILLNAGLHAGATQVILPRFDPEVTLHLIEKYHVTDLFAVPPALLALVHFPGAERFDTSSLRYILSGAAPLPPEVGIQAGRRYGCAILQGYGMTETSPTTNSSPLERVKMTSVGPPVADTLEKIVDLESDEELAIGGVGELLVQGPQVMGGYWRRPDATAETMTKDGWLRTGDIARMDEDGYVYILDRKKEMIKYKGYQVAPAELEAVLMEHPDVRDAAVVPQPHFESGERPKAFVVLHDGAHLSADALMQFVSERVAPYKKVREVEFLDAIPKNPSGKILRRDLIDRERARHEAT